jgi:GNAT superfamily N-acetyltransferase
VSDPPRPPTHALIAIEWSPLEGQYLYVAPAHRRTGVATVLLRQLAEWFEGQGAARICVDVNDESPGARLFYASHGAQPLRPNWMVWPDISTVLARQR